MTKMPEPNDDCSTTEREPVDMSPAAVRGRLETLRALYKLMVYLGQARVDQAKPVEPR
jgi:hypothetical protein